jgi:predicted nucleotidyltransferase
VAGPAPPALVSRAVEHLAARLAAIPGVVAVTLGGSRATNTAVEGSDWDFGLYYRGRLERAGLHAVQDRLGPPERDLGAVVSDVRACLELTDAVW